MKPLCELLYDRFNTADMRPVCFRSLDDTHARIVDRHIVFDARWLEFSGIGRSIEVILRSFRNNPPPGHWTVLARSDAVRELLWPQATVVVLPKDPRRRVQELFTQIPRGDVLFFPQQIRRFYFRPTAQVIYDLIPVKAESRRIRRIAHHLYFLGLSLSSDSILSISDNARSDIFHYLRVDSARVFPFTFPFDTELRLRVASLQQSNLQRQCLLFVGRIAPHKNLSALLEAFAASMWNQTATLVIAGDGSPVDREALNASAERLGVRCEITGHVSQPALDLLFATSRALVQPSLIEGFGLPILEALSCGLPVAASSACPAADGIADNQLVFDPTHTESMIHALNHLWAISAIERRLPNSDDLLDQRPRPAVQEQLDLVRTQVLDAIEQVLVHPRRRFRVPSKKRFSTRA